MMKLNHCCIVCALSRMVPHTSQCRFTNFFMNEWPGKFDVTLIWLSPGEGCERGGIRHTPSPHIYMRKEIKKNRHQTMKFNKSLSHAKHPPPLKLLSVKSVEPNSLWSVCFCVSVCVCVGSRLLLLLGVCVHGWAKRTHAHEDVVVLLRVRSTKDVLNQRVKVGHHIKASAAP